MTEEQVKQVVADMIFSGELEIRMGNVFDPFKRKNEVTLTIFHNKEDGYRKKLLSRSARK